GQRPEFRIVQLCRQFERWSARWRGATAQYPDDRNETCRVTQGDSGRHVDAPSSMAAPHTRGDRSIGRNMEPSGWLPAPPPGGRPAVRSEPGDCIWRPNGPGDTLL